jgi:hypothetical protein
MPPLTGLGFAIFSLRAHDFQNFVHQLSLVTSTTIEYDSTTKILRTKIEINKSPIKVLYGDIQLVPQFDSIWTAKLTLMGWGLVTIF